jgi:hypothetical protein
MSSELSQVITTINNEINTIIERNLLPHFETIRIIENLLKQLPEFKRLEQENADLKKRLSLCSVNNQADLELSNEEIHNDTKQPVPVKVIKNEIKLEIVEPPSTKKIVSETELYSTVNLLNTVDNKLQDENDSDSDEDVIEVEVEEEEVEVIEVDESEEEEEEEEEEDGGEGLSEQAAEPLEEEDEDEEEEEDGVEGAEPLEEEDEEEEEVVEEDEEEEVVEEEEESGGEGEDPLEEDGGEGLAEQEADPLEEEVFIIEIKGRGRFYTSNETNGDIYQIEGEDDVGDVVGKFVNKVAKFN